MASATEPLRDLEVAIDQGCPRRRFQLLLDLQADSLDDLADSLRRLALSAELGELPIERVSGGVSDGYTLTLDEDPAMTHERYVELLNAYVNRPRGGQPTDSRGWNR